MNVTFKKNFDEIPDCVKFLRKRIIKRSEKCLKKNSQMCPDAGNKF